MFFSKENVLTFTLYRITFLIENTVTKDYIRTLFLILVIHLHCTQYTVTEVSFQRLFLYWRPYHFIISIARDKRVGYIQLIYRCLES